MFAALQATSLTLAGYLDSQFLAEPALSAVNVSLKTPAEMVKSHEQGLSLWLYQAQRDEQRLNLPAVRISATELRPPPLPMRLHYLLTPITDKRQGSPETEQLILGKVLQAFHTRPTLRGTDLAGVFEGTDAELQVRLEPLTLEEITRVWQALDESYQLSVSYEISLVDIDSALQPESAAPVVVVLPDYGTIVG